MREPDLNGVLVIDDLTTLRVAIDPLRPRMLAFVSPAGLEGFFEEVVERLSEAPVIAARYGLELGG